MTKFICLSFFITILSQSLRKDRKKSYHFIGFYVRLILKKCPFKIFVLLFIFFDFFNNFFMCNLDSFLKVKVMCLKDKISEMEKI